ncbi:RecQ family ATP-dependent DNA helicase [Massilibacterium senegalense]|uniref:RecQ family ATP-dependent DNA helicase n=1 Tax=Massilibacterium senegalense TaxID=1632858 RepID=UPI000783C8CA|nr:ATP-dependent DNA helicase RecQ [Massilibacterium senegalense]
MIALEQALKHYFHYDSFREGQKEIIQDVLKGNNVLAMLATGVGKSLCYLLPGYMMNGTVLIVSPLLSLMEDQVNQLRKKGEKHVVAINSFLSPNEKRDVLASLHFYRFIYISPESLQNEQIIRALEKIAVTLFVVDEAHCISAWGHDFRTDYLKISTIHHRLKTPPLLALTATATEAVQKDIIEQLKLSKVKRHIYSVDRPNIALYVEYVQHELEKQQKLIEYVKSLQKPGLVYVSSRQKTELIADALRENGVHHVSYYHGGMTSEDRMLIQQQFLHNQLDVLVCTSAFGMGINKDNIRFIIHYGLSQDMESYMQEIGRAGRDGLQSIALLLYAEGDERIPLSFIEQDLPTEKEVVQWLMLCLQTKNVYQATETMELSEGKERYLLFQLEQAKGYKENGEVVDFSFEEIKQTIMEAIQVRKKTKIKKVIQMTQWLQTERCYREELLRIFHQQKEKQPIYCCNHCQFPFEPFLSKKETKDVESMDWQKRLAFLFHEEESR